MQHYLYQDLYNLEETHWWHRSKFQLVQGAISRLVPTTSSNVKLLDIGCGTGQILTLLSHFGTASGIDVSPEAIKFCKRRKLTRVSVGSSYNTGFAKNSMDVITILDVLEHTDERKTLKEIMRILKPGGFLILTVPAYQWLWSRWDEVLMHKKRYTVPSLTYILQTSGFHVLKISYAYSFLLLPIIVIRFLKKLLHKKEYGSDFAINTPFINAVMEKLCSLERGFVLAGLVPFGTSVFCVARKRFVTVQTPNRSLIVRA